MKVYEVYILVGGLMEDSDFHKEDVFNIEAATADEAITKWTTLTGCVDDNYLIKGKNGVGWSYFFPIFCIVR